MMNPTIKPNKTEGVTKSYPLGSEVVSEFLQLQKFAASEKRIITFRRLQDQKIELLLIGGKSTNHHVVENNKMVGLHVYCNDRDASEVVRLFESDGWQAV